MVTNLKGKFACRLCRHDQYDHNLMVGCPHCRCMATPAEGAARSDVEDFEILPPGTYHTGYEPKQPMEEPQKIGAKVKGRDGSIWTRCYHTSASGQQWWSNAGYGWKTWPFIQDPEPYTEPEGAEKAVQKPLSTQDRRDTAAELLEVLTRFIEVEPRLTKEEHAVLDTLANFTLPEYIRGGF